MTALEVVEVNFWPLLEIHSAYKKLCKSPKFLCHKFTSWKCIALDLGLIFVVIFGPDHHSDGVGQFRFTNFDSRIAQIAGVLAAV